MEHSVHIDPEKCVLVMGPQMAAEALSLSEGVPAALSYAMLVNIGIQRALDLDKNSGNAEKARKHALLVNAYELEPAFAAFKVVETLNEKNVYKEWLTELFGSLPSLHAMSRVKQEGGSLVEKLAVLQDKGVLLVYTHFDNILDVQMGTEPVLLQDDEAVRTWGSQGEGILHVHGLFSKPESVTYDCVDYRRLVGGTPGGLALKEIFRGRSVIFAGFDGEFYDPFLPKFAQTFLSQEHPPPLLLSAAPKVTSLTEAFLSLKVSELSHVDQLIVPRPPAAHLGCTRDSAESKLTTTLLYSNKTNCLEAAELVKVTAAVNVHQLTMRHESSHHLLLLYLDRDGLKELWKLIFAATSPAQPGLHAGLLGIVLDDVVTVWLDGGVALTQVGGAQMKQATSGAMSLHVETSQGVSQSAHMAPPLSSHVTPPPSLSTNVALIGSTWTPIPASSISRPLSTASSASTSVARVSHTSPLVSSTSRTSQGTVATRGPLTDTHHILMSVGPSHRPHNQVRRVQSERVMYKDRQVKQAFIRNKNGLLLHRESAPEFVQTSEGLVAYPSNPSSYRERSGILIGQSRPSPSSSHHAPHHHHHIQQSPLVKGGAHMDVKPDVLNIQRPIHATPTSRAVAVAPSSGSSVQFKGIGSNRPILAVSGAAGVPGKEFHEEKQKFIMEAQSWSKQVDSDLAKKTKSTSSPAIPLIATSSSIPSSRTVAGLVGGAYPMGILSAAAHQLVPPGAQPSLTSKFSLEEQEKLLKQHFDLTLQQQLLSSMGGLPLGMSIHSPAKSPGGSSAGYSHHQSPPTATSSISALTPPQQQPAAIPLAVASSSGTSPKKAPPLSMLQPAATQGASPLGVFPFLPTSGNTAGLLCNPSLAQFPMAAAAMFNPVYQAALQNLINSGQVPGVSVDPALFQAGMMDKVPQVLPDGRIGLVPLGGGGASQQQGGVVLQQLQGGGDTSPAKETVEEEEQDDEDDDESREEEEDSDTLKSPITVGYKRMRSPGVEGGQFRGSLPKRRRSSSLPDINHLLHISPHKKFHEEVIEDRKERSLNPVSQDKKSNGITNAMVPPAATLGGSSPRPRQQAPPTMIHIPQDVKIDPMLGFPTPPQNSPLRGAFSLSPVVLPSVQYHTTAQQHPHQPMTPVTPQDPLHTVEEFRELVEAGELSTTLPPSPEGSALPPFPAGRGPIQLWQFLLDLLLSPDKQHMIHWTGNGYEFCIILPEDIAKLWGARKNKPRMNYDKLSRGLRYYYNKGIMDKVQGKKLTFKYTCDVHHYIRSRNAQSHAPSTPHATPTGGEYRSGSSTPVMMHVMGDSVADGDEGSLDEAGVAMLAERNRLYGPAATIPEEMELAPAPGYHQRIKKAAGGGNISYNEGETPRCDIQGLMGMVKGYGGVLSVVGSESHGTPERLPQQHSLCSEAV